MQPEALNLLVFRADRRPARGRELKSRLLRRLRALQPGSTSNAVESALLLAGELECAVADAGDVPGQPLSNLTDRLAEKLVAPLSPLDLDALIKSLAQAPVPETLSVSVPEGFAYYALHPLAYADVLDKVLDRASVPGEVAVLGIRSIGTTLSAVAAAAARARGLSAQRITVRPTGHPYNRNTRFSGDQLRFVQNSAAANALFLVVDEGPGLSGSSFLSVAEALVQAGAPRRSIVLVCGHQPHLETLRAHDGPNRARCFRWVAVASEPRRPAEAELFIGGGCWREFMLPEKPAWPPSWITFERLKYLSAPENPGRRFFKFAGFGHYGEEVLERERVAAEAAFAPPLQVESHGFASYPLLAGRPMHAGDLSVPALARLAEYCAFRMRAFRFEAANLGSLQEGALQEMAQHNLSQLGFGRAPELKLQHPVIGDARMQPHEWLATADNRMLKTDSGSHGDDHFFPGITDIAWDLAGAIVEWHMNAAQSEIFLEAYRRLSGDDSRPRLEGFITAYTVFRCAYCRMAANAMQGSEEQAWLDRAAAAYREILSSRVGPRDPQRQAPSLTMPAA